MSDEKMIRQMESIIEKRCEKYFKELINIQFLQTQLLKKTLEELNMIRRRLNDNNIGWSDSTKREQNKSVEGEQSVQSATAVLK